VDLHDIRVRQLRRRERLAGEPRDEHRVTRPPLAHHLESDRPVERELPGEVHCPHAAAAEFVFDGVPAHVRARADYDLPVVFARLVIRAGRAVEPPDLSGSGLVCAKPKTCDEFGGVSARSVAVACAEATRPSATTNSLDPVDPLRGRRPACR